MAIPHLVPTTQQLFLLFVDESDNAIYVYSAYIFFLRGGANEKALSANVKNCIHEGGTRKAALSKT